MCNIATILSLYEVMTLQRLRYSLNPNCKGIQTYLTLNQPHNDTHKILKGIFRLITFRVSGYIFLFKRMSRQTANYSCKLPLLPSNYNTTLYIH